MAHCSFLARCSTCSSSRGGCVALRLGAALAVLLLPVPISLSDREQAVQELGLWDAVLALLGDPSACLPQGSAQCMLHNCCGVMALPLGLCRSVQPMALILNPAIIVLCSSG